MTGSIRPHCDPVSGISASPFMGLWFWHASRMRPRDILAANLNALIDGHPTFGSPPALVRASGIPNGTLGRIRTAEVATTVDKLQGLATAFNVEPWVLLVPPSQREAMQKLVQAMETYAKPSQPAQPEAAVHAPRKRLGERR